MENAKRVLYDRVVYAKSARACIRGADCCIVATGWPEFAEVGPSEFKRLMRNPVVVDGRRVLDEGALRAKGVRFVTIGSGS